MRRSRLVAFLCRLAGHPEDVLICPFHVEGIHVASTCPCGQKYRELV